MKESSLDLSSCFTAANSTYPEQSKEPKKRQQRKLLPRQRDELLYQDRGLTWTESLSYLRRCSVIRVNSLYQSLSLF